MVRPWCGRIAGPEGLSFGGDPLSLPPIGEILQFTPSLDVISLFLC